MHACSPLPAGWLHALSLRLGLRHSAYCRAEDVRSPRISVWPKMCFKWGGGFRKLVPLLGITQSGFYILLGVEKEYPYLGPILRDAQNRFVRVCKTHARSSAHAGSSTASQGELQRTHAKGPLLGESTLLQQGCK